MDWVIKATNLRVRSVRLTNQVQALAKGFHFNHVQESCIQTKKIIRECRAYCERRLTELGVSSKRKVTVRIRDMNAVKWVHHSEGVQELKLKDNIGTSGDKLAINSFSLEIGRKFLTFRGIRFWNSVLIGVGNLLILSWSMRNFWKRIYDTVVCDSRELDSVNQEILSHM